MEVLEDADLALVELKPASNGTLYPYCRLHGAMAKITPEGIWRCVSTYVMFTGANGNKRLRENACRAGCFYPKIEKGVMK